MAEVGWEREKWGAGVSGEKVGWGKGGTEVGVTKLKLNMNGRNSGKTSECDL